jgi:hypothetical protein
MSLQQGTMRKLGRALALVVLLVLVSASGDARHFAAPEFTVLADVAWSVKAVADFRLPEWSSESALWRLAEPLDSRGIAVQRTVPNCSSGGRRDCGIRTSF